MTLRCQILLPLLSACITFVSGLRPSSGQVVGQKSSDAKILVTVRTGKGTAVPGLQAADFVVTEHGIQDRISGIENLSRSPSVQIPISSESKQKITVYPPEAGTTISPLTATYVLLIITPMSATGRYDAIRAAVKILSHQDAQRWRVALLDDSGAFVTFGNSMDQLTATLESLGKKVPFPQYVGGSWLENANKAIRELGTMPGPHAIVVVSDYESKLPAAIKENPWLQRVSPSMFIDSALRAHAGLYTVQSSGPATVVPFGGAAAPQIDGFQSGEDVAETLMNDTVAVGTLRSDLLYAADATGGKPAKNLKDAFSQIAADAEGTYLISFHPDLNETDGAWHPVSVSLREPDLRVRGPGFYEAPSMSTAQLPSGMLTALQRGGGFSELGIATHAWLFPDSRSGIDNIAIAAAVEWIDKVQTPKDGSRLQVFAELINENTNAVAGSWYEEREWDSAGSQPLRFNWQREVPVYPGSYVLRVFGMDTVSEKIGAGEFSFWARPQDGGALRFGTIVLADGCTSAREQKGTRKNLLDPLLWDGCELMPSPEAIFNSRQSPTILVHIYPPNDQMTKMILQEWKAFAVVDGEDGKIAALPIASADVRGLAAFGTVNLRDFNLPSGPHQLSVIFEIPAMNGEKRRVSLKTQFFIQP
jgi:VWFA-related protein